MPVAQSSVSVFALSVSWLWNTQINCGFLAYISRERVHSPAWEKPGEKTSTFIGHQRHRQRHGERTGVCVCVRGCLCMGILDSVLKEILTAYGYIQQRLMPAMFILQVLHPKGEKCCLRRWHIEVGRQQGMSESSVNFTPCLLRYLQSIDFWRQRVSFSVYDIPQSCVPFCDNNKNKKGILKLWLVTNYKCINVCFWPNFFTFDAIST